MINGADQRAREVIMAAYEATPEELREQFRNLFSGAYKAPEIALALEYLGHDVSPFEIRRFVSLLEQGKVAW